MTSIAGYGHGYVKSTSLLINDKIEGIKPYIFICIGDGYTENDLQDYHTAIRTFYNAWRNEPALLGLQISAQVWVIDAISDDHGIGHDVEADNIVKNTILGFDVLSPNPDYLDAIYTNQLIYDNFSKFGFVPNARMVLVNKKIGFGVTGNGPTLIQYSPCWDNSGYPTGLHEWGHGGGANLADEYTVHDNGFPYTGPEPSQPNVTANTNYNTLKWKSLVTNPLTLWPTTLNPDTTHDNAVDPYPGGVGLYEGGLYKHKGIFRSQMHCRMNDGTNFCVVCTSAIRALLLPYTLQQTNHVLPTTTNIDRFRQGVELTQQKHFDAGIVKIWSGERHNELFRANFGQETTNYNDIVFLDRSYTDAVTTLKTNVITQTLTTFGDETENSIIDYDNLYVITYNNHYVVTIPSIGHTSYTKQQISTFQIPYGSLDYVAVRDYTFDGILEPLTIRLTNSYIKSDMLREAHSCNGEIESGNSDSERSSDMLLSVDVFSAKLYDSFVDDKRSNETVKSIGFFSIENTINPFVDNRQILNFLDKEEQFQHLGLDIVSAVSLMTGSTENYVNASEISSTSGFVFDTAGTDSIAFGGFAY